MKAAIHKISFLIHFGVYILLALILSVASGCKLISYHPDGLLSIGNWHELEVPIPPDSELEKLAVESAQKRRVVTNDEMVAIPIAVNETNQLVVTVVGLAPHSDPMLPKKITTFRIINGNIGAFSKTIEQPSPDVDYEETLFNAAMISKTKRYKEVIIYTRPDENLLVVGDAKGCMAKVTVHKGLEKNATPFAERVVPVCSR